MDKRSILIVVIFVGLFAHFAWADDVRLHVLRDFWIKYKQDGMMMKGEIISQCRNWCNEAAETRKIKISAGGMTQYQNTRSVTIKDKIYNTDLDTGRTTVVSNPMYESIVESVKRKGTKDLNASILSAWGFRPTDNVRKIAGETCRDYISDQMTGVTNCFTDDGMALRTEAPGMVQVAVEFRRNDPGDETAYEVPKNPVQPEIEAQPGMNQLEEILKKMQMPSQAE
ncbi:MAG: hypothetical protein R3274_08575 [Desulfobacterales bacterium]|nr:hypothetical protein [Desulfobacterales bacterium]